VRYQVGGMGMMIRYPVSARFAGDDGIKDDMKVQYTLDTKNKIMTRTKTHNKTTSKQYSGIDRSKLVFIKAISQHPFHPDIRPSDMDNLYLRLVLTQTTQCLIAPHYRGDFARPDHPPRMITIDDPIFDKAKE
jgi:hypothetical protein